MPSRALRMALVLVGAIALIAGGTAAWRQVVVPRVEAHLSDVIGHRVTIRGVRLGWRALVARHVQIQGAPPFDGEPLARVDRIRVRLGGCGGCALWTPSEVRLEGMELEYLASGDVDNVRGNRSGKGQGGSGGFRPIVAIRDGRVRGIVQPARGPRITFRTKELNADWISGQRADVVLGQTVIEVAGWLTVTSPRIHLSDSAGDRSATAQEINIAVPGGGMLSRGLTLKASMNAERSELSLLPREGLRGGGALRVGGRADERGTQLTAEATDLPLRALAPLLGPHGVHVDDATVDARLMATGRRDLALPFELDLRARGVRLATAALDRLPWDGVSAEFHATGQFEPGTSTLRVHSGEIAALGAKLRAKGWTSFGEVPAGAWAVSTRGPLPCAPLLGAQARPVREVLTGLSLEGYLGATAQLEFDGADWEALTFDVTLDPLCDVQSEPALLARLLPTLTRGEPPAEGTSALPLGAYHPDFVPLNRLPAHLPAAFVTAEDGRFFTHRGFDPEMIRRALAHDLETRTFGKGASTITQQVAKNLFLTPDRTLARKLEETVLAWRLEKLLPKQRLLELYLNVVEMGPGLRGVKAASRAYFGKEPIALTPLEAAHLAALAPNPLGLSRRFRDGQVDDGWLHRLYDLLGMMKRSGRLSPQDLAAARSGRLQLQKI